MIAVDRFERSAAVSMQPKAAPLGKFRHDGHINSDVKEASDLAILPDGRFLVVSDTKAKLGIVIPSGRVEHIELEHSGKKASGFEAVAFNPSEQRLFVVREEKNELIRYDWRGSGRASYDKTFELALDGKKNKGIEGACFLPKRGLLLAKEGDPKQLLLFAESGKGKPVKIDIAKDIKDACGDFAGLAFDAKSGHLFICSEESSLVVEARLVDENGKLTCKLVAQHALTDKQGKPLERVEGIAVDAQGMLYALSENDGKIHRYKR